MLWSIGQDVRFALRQIRRAPAFATSAILTLALGIGANTGIFSILNGYSRPLPVPHADRIVVLAADLPGDETGFRYRFSYAALNDYRTGTGVFANVFAFDTRISGLTAGEKTTQFVYHAVTGDFFSGLQLAPLLGRFIEPGEGEHAGGETVIVLGYQFWQRRFGGNPDVVGITVRIDGQPARIIGVAPPGFHGLYQGADIEGYVPLGTLRGRGSQTARLFTDRTIRFLTVVARLRPGASVKTAQVAVDVIAQRLQREYPQEKGITARVLPEPLARPIPMRFLSELVPLIQGSMLGLAGLVLLIACMNVANLLLVRATVRQREMAMRAALGSGRARLVRLLLVESLLLAFAGTAIGLLFARWATAIFAGSLNVSVNIPLNLDFHYDWRVFGYASAIAAVTGGLMGLVPALRASRAEVSALLHDGGHGGSSGGGKQRLRSGMVVAQVAGSLVLLIVAGLCIRSSQRAQLMDLGFDPSNVLTLRVDPHQVGYSGTKATAFYEELDRKLRALPSVESVGMTFSVPMGYIFDGCAAAPEGQVAATDEPEFNLGCNPVTPEYFDLMRIPVLKGRAFTLKDDDTSAHVVIINETLARRFWPGRNPIGRTLVIPRFEGRLWEVVGVARDSKYLAVFEQPLPHIYFPMRQTPSYMRVIYLRSSMPPELLGPLVEREIQALDPEVPIADVKTLSEVIQGGMGFLLFKVGTLQAGAMGILGLLLAVVGVYGVVSYGASQRTREMGIRLALGADPAVVRALVLRQGAVLVVAGIVCGLLVAAGVTRALARIFFLAGTNDVATFAGVTALLAAIALIACYLPARRAMRVDPMIALRHE
jgi:macrolide transport system ATP-binding/permease protein